mgnify:CR=1 FL=1
MPLDPQVAGILSMMPQGGPALTDDALAETRAGFGMMMGLGVGEVPEIASAIDMDADGVPVRVYTPTGDAPGVGRPVVVFFHGGGWTIGDVEGYDPFTRLLAAETDAVVVSVDYRLAPEHPHPAAADDAFTALRWVAANAASIGGDASRIAVAGDSAGGNLSAVAALDARDAGEPDLVLQVLIYPVTDCLDDRGSYLDNATGYFLERTSMQYFFDAYAHRAGVDAAHPRVSPLRAESHAGVAPAVVITAEFDPLRDEGNDYAAALRAAGVDVEHQQYDGMIHGFVAMPGIIAGGRTGLDQVVRALRRAFGTV